MNIPRRTFMENVIAGAAGLAALTRSVRVLAKDLPSDPEASVGQAPGPDQIVLPKFEKSSAFALDQALLQRHSSRNYDPEGTVSREQLSRILWAANGVNRADGHRTTPSALARYPIEIYAALSEGAFRYEVKEHQLVRVTAEDLREQIPLQPALKKAAMKLMYVINHDWLLGSDPWMFYLEIGCMVQNVYLEAAALGLGSCVFAMAHSDNITKALKLKSSQKYRITQAVGPLRD
jgi:SagB-type dehydrogenase family enzyme